MIFKDGVQIRGVQPEIAVALTVLATIRPEAVVTSVVDGKHSSGSLHYTGSAFDMRTRHLRPSEVDSIANQLRAALTDEFDVVVEETHIHVEFQPKRPIS